jgi:hypothetical protein
MEGPLTPVILSEAKDLIAVRAAVLARSVILQ